MPDSIAASTWRYQSAIKHATPQLLPAVASGLTYDAEGKRLIDSIDLTLTAGPLTVIMGPNGAGKSLLLRLLHGLIFPSSGKILWNGSPLEDESRRHQAMVFQRPILLRRSVAANIDFVLRLRGLTSTEERNTILDHMGLYAHKDQPARLLSGGEQQRLALARALATHPEILFLDEPTASLDPASVHLIERAVQSAREEGTKIIFVTHDIGQARRLADEVIFLHRGRLLEQSLAGSFFKTPSSPQARDYLAGRLVL